MKSDCKATRRDLVKCFKHLYLSVRRPGAKAKLVLKRSMNLPENKQLSDFDELEELDELGPGSLTISDKAPPPKLPPRFLGQLSFPTAKRILGMLSIPSFSTFERPSLEKNDLGKIPSHPRDSQDLLELDFAEDSANYEELSDFDELEDIDPGSLTLLTPVRPRKAYLSLFDQHSSSTSEPTRGQLSVPPPSTSSDSTSSKPPPQKREPGRGPSHYFQHLLLATGFRGRGPGQILTPGEMKPYSVNRRGIPRHPGTNAVRNATAGQSKERKKNK